MSKKAIWVDIALLCCIFIRLQLVKVQSHNRAMSSHINCLLTHQIIYIYMYILAQCLLHLSTQKYIVAVTLCLFFLTISELPCTLRLGKTMNAQ